VEKSWWPLGSERTVTTNDWSGAGHRVMVLDLRITIARIFEFMDTILERN